MKPAAEPELATPVLADTPTWIAHFRITEPQLSWLLDNGRVWVHPMILGELALGGLKRTSDAFQQLQRLPRAPVATAQEFHLLVESHAGAIRGLGFVDAHLLASCLIARLGLLTEDRRLARAHQSLAGLIGRDAATG
jgi:predicted nucleic acid-binding protein